MSRKQKEDRQEFSHKFYIDTLSSRNIETARDALQQEMSSFPYLNSHLNPHAIQASVKIGDEPSIEVHAGNKSPKQGADAINADTACHIASMTKTFTAAALLKLWDDELTNIKAGIEVRLPHLFPKGMQTPLSHFMPALREKFPDNMALTAMEEVEHYSQVTLQDLLNHTHGLGDKNPRALREAQIADPQKQYSCSELIAGTTRGAKDIYGRFKYGNLGTDLSGMIIELATGVSYDQALKDIILTPMGAQNTYVLSEAPAAYANPETNIASGYSHTSRMRLAYNTGDVIKESGIIDNNTSSNGRGCASLKSSPDDCHIFLRAYLSKDPEVSMFNNQEVRDTLWDRTPVVTAKGEERDYQFSVADCGDGYYGHDGIGTGFNSFFSYNPETDTSFYYAAAGENKTYNMAFEIAAKVNPEKFDARELDPKEDIMPIRDQLIARYNFEAIRDNGEEIMEHEVKIREEKQEKQPETTRHGSIKDGMYNPQKKVLGAHTAQVVNGRDSQESKTPSR